MGMQNEKLHAACDECRTRKLKCSGDTPACSRCSKEKINCVYSPQKPMGRPRKRRREERRSEDVQVASIESAPIDLENFPIADLGDGGFTSQTDLTNDLTGFMDFSTADSISGCPLISYTKSSTPITVQDPNYMDPIDPSLWQVQPNDASPNTQSSHTPDQPDMDPCSCLSAMYLTVTDLQSINNFTFPAVVPRLRHALTTASNIVNCPKCPSDTFSAIQNIQCLNSLLSALGQRFHNVLAEIDAEARRCESTGTKKSFRIGDNNPENMHLHTGSPDCPMSYNVELEPKEWKRLAKKMLRTEVEGGGSNPTPLMAVIEQLESRQVIWHQNPDIHGEERERLYGSISSCVPGEMQCLRTVNQVRGMVGRMDWE